MPRLGKAKSLIRIEKRAAQVTARDIIELGDKITKALGSINLQISNLPGYDSRANLYYVIGQIKTLSEKLALDMMTLEKASIHEQLVGAYDLEKAYQQRDLEIKEIEREKKERRKMRRRVEK